MSTPAQTEARSMTLTPDGRYPRLARMLDALARRVSAETPLSEQEVRRALGLPGRGGGPGSNPPPTPRGGNARSHDGNYGAQNVVF